MVTRRQIDAYTGATQKLIDAVNARLSQVVRRLDWSNPEAAIAVLVRVYPALMDDATRVAVQAAIEWYNQIRASEVGQSLTGQVDPAVLPARAYQRDVYWATDKVRDLSRDLVIGQVVTRLGAGVQLGVRGAGRDAVKALIDADPRRPRWARVPKGKTCAWCSMLASRGWVYKSPQSAGDAANRFHSHCDCQIVPSWDKDKAHIDGYDPERLYAHYKEAWKQVKAGLPEHDYPRDFQVAKRMRRLFPKAYSDGVLRGGMMDCDYLKVIEDLKRQKNSAEKIARFKRQYAMASAAADFSDLVYPDGSVDLLEWHELDFVERFVHRGERIKWIPKDIVEFRSTNDFYWLTNDGLVCELKAPSPKYPSIKFNIRKAVVNARGKHGVVKDVFMIDLGRYRLTEKLRHHLGLYNKRVKEAPIHRLFVFHGEPPELTEINLR